MAGKISVRGLPELQAKLRDIMDASVGAEMVKVVGDASDEVRLEVLAQAMVVRVPHEVLDSVFSYRKQPPSPTRSEVSALAGIRKRGRSRPFAPAYREWRAGRHPKSARAKAAPGSLIGESLAEMWEIGTTKRPATPFFRRAISSVRGRVTEAIAAGFVDILRRHTR